MPVLTMPDGTNVDFGNMPKDQILAKIRTKFPDFMQAKPAKKDKLYVPGLSEISNTGNSIGTGIIDPVVGVAQFVPRALSYATSLGNNYPNIVSKAYDTNAKQIDDVINARERIYNEQVGRDENSGLDVGRLVGNIASPVNYIAPGGGGGTAVTKSGGVVKAAKDIASGAAKTLAAGAALGVAQPIVNAGDDYAAKKTEQVATTTAGLGVGTIAGKALGRLISPKTSGNVKELLDQGVVLTPGSILGGFWKGLEDKASSIPLLGDFIAGAQQESIKSFNRVAINRALKPIGKELPKGMVGREAIQFAKESLGQAYDNLLPNLNGRVDKQFIADLTKISNMSKSMGQQQRNQFKQIIVDNIRNKMSPSGGFTGEGLKEIESELGLLSKVYRRGGADERRLGMAIQEVQTSLRDMLVRSNPAHAEELQAINSGYANFKRVQRAATYKSAAKDSDKIFTPSNLDTAVKALDTSKDKARYAEGKALMQDLSDKAASVIPSKYPDSGTAGRVLQAASLGAGHFINPAFYAPLLATMAYTRPGMKAAEYALTKRPAGAEQLANIIRRVGSISGLATGVALSK